MTKLILVTVFLLLSIPTAQNHDGILITIEKGHKKITYMAENVTDKDIDLFFKVDSNGFRRSADRPQITTIPAKKKLALATLIPLTGKDTTHSYVAIITKKANDLAIIKTDSLGKDIRRIEPSKKNSN